MSLVVGQKLLSIGTSNIPNLFPSLLAAKEQACTDIVAGTAVTLTAVMEQILHQCGNRT